MDFMWQPLNNVFDFYIQSMLQLYFMSPAKMMSRGDEMEKFMKHYSLDGIKSFSICRP